MIPKPFYQSKVFWLNVVAFLVAAAAIVQASPIFPRDWTDGLALVVALLNLWLRWGTDRPLSLTRDEDA
jgi:hypothetical protein